MTDYKSGGRYGTAAILVRTILHGSSRQQDTSLDGEGIERFAGLVVAILEPMGFITNK